MSGREQVLKGALLDALRVPTRSPSTTVTVSNEAGTGTTGTFGATTTGGGGVSSSAASTVTQSTLHTESGSHNKNEIRTMQPRLHIPTTITTTANTNAAPIPSHPTQPLPVPPPQCDKIVHIPGMLPSTIEETDIFGNGYDSDDSESEALLNNNTATGNVNPENATTSKHYVQELYDIEVLHWKGINFTSVVNSPLQIPSAIATPNKYMSVYTNSSVKGVVTCMRMFPLAHALYTSLLVCGLCNGRIIVYSVRYTGEPAEILCTSALPNKAEQAPIVDIKCGSTGVSSLVCMNSAGVVNVFHVNTALCTTTTTALQPVARKKWSLFRTKTAPKSNTMASIHSINSNDFIFTLPTLQETLNMSASDAQDLSNLTIDSLTTGTTTNKGTTKPSAYSSNLSTSICFHPSVTLFGSNVSFLVGATNGDVIKYNYDYIHNTLASPIINTTPFVSKEFIHPNNAVKGFVLTNGVNEKLGNKVYRELFHYHKSKIVLLDVVNAISPYLLSVDQSGRVALWHYDSKYFEGKCWFRPYCTTKLALDVVDLLPTGDIIMYGGSKAVTTTSTVDVAATTEPVNAFTQPNEVKPDALSLSEETLAKLVIRDAYQDDSGIHSVGNGSAEDRVCFTYEPIFDSERGVYVQYTAVEYTMKIEPEVKTAKADTKHYIIDDASSSVAVRQDAVPIVNNEATGATGNSVLSASAPAEDNTLATPVKNNNDADLAAYLNESEGVDAEASEYAALLRLEVDPAPTATTDVPSVEESKITNNNNNTNADHIDGNNSFDGDGIRVTTASSDVLVEPSATSPIIIDEEAVNTVTDSDNPAVELPGTLETSEDINPTERLDTHTSGEMDVVQSDEVVGENTVEEVSESAAIRDAAGKTIYVIFSISCLLSLIKIYVSFLFADPAEDAPSQLPVDVDTNYSQERSHSNKSTEPIPVTIFTALTALIEQYREQKHIGDGDTYAVEQVRLKVFSFVSLLLLRLFFTFLFVYFG